MRLNNLFESMVILSVILHLTMLPSLAETAPTGATSSANQIKPSLSEKIQRMQNREEKLQYRINSGKLSGTKLTKAQVHLSKIQAKLAKLQAKEVKAA